jgi:hypothetical protein
MKNLDFRKWLYELWVRNCKERNDYHELPYSQAEYFQRYKYWLKREYRHQTRVSTY